MFGTRFSQQIVVLLIVFAIAIISNIAFAVKLPSKKIFQSVQNFFDSQRLVSVESHWSLRKFAVNSPSNYLIQHCKPEMETSRVDRPVGLPVGSRFFDRPVKPVEKPVKFSFLATKRQLSTNQDIL